MKKIIVIIMVSLFILGVFCLKNREMNAEDITYMRASCDGKDVIETYDTAVIKETLNTIKNIPKKRMLKKPETDDAVVMSITFENSSRTENMKVIITYLKEEIYLGIDNSWYKTEMTLEDVWAFYEGINCK